MSFIVNDDAALLMVDHQTGLLQTVRDIDVLILRANAMALVGAAKLLSLPIISTASMPDGPNGPLIREIASLDTATFISRSGEVNAWDAPAFADAVRATGRKTLIVAGVWTSVCVAFPSISALAEGFNVYAVIDASGDVSTLASDMATRRLAHAGATVTTTNAVVSEMLKTWNRPDAVGFLSVFRSTTPSYSVVVETFETSKKSAGA